MHPNNSLNHFFLSLYLIIIWPVPTVGLLKIKIIYKYKPIKSIILPRSCIYYNGHKLSEIIVFFTLNKYFFFYQLTIFNKNIMFLINHISN